MEMPEPEETGSTGTQQVGTAQIVSAEKESPLEGLPITRTVEGLAATRARSMGGEVAASLIAGSFTQLSFNLQETRQELHETRKELKQAGDELSNYKIRAAVLEERVNSVSKERHLKNLSIAAGTVLIGMGIEFYRNNFDKFAYIVAGVGVVLIFLGWFSKGEGAEK